MRFNQTPIPRFGIRLDSLDCNQSVTARMVRELRASHPLILLRGFRPPAREELVRLASSDGRDELLRWNFGPVMEMKEDETSRNYLFSNEAVPFHWDGAFHRVPSWLVFHCIQAPMAGAGGETLFANTALIAEEASRAQLKAWEHVHLTYRTDKLAHYGGVTSGPLLQRHPRLGHSILRFAEPVATARNPVSLEVDGLPPHLDADAWIESMRSLIYDERYCYMHRWQEGDLLIVDNHGFIHGRRAFTSQTPRWLRRVQIL